MGHYHIFLMEVEQDEVLIDTEQTLDQEFSDDDMMDDNEQNVPAKFPKLAPSMLEVSTDKFLIIALIHCIEWKACYSENCCSTSSIYASQKRLDQDLYTNSKQYETTNQNESKATASGNTCAYTFPPQD